VVYRSEAVEKKVTVARLVIVHIQTAETAELFAVVQQVIDAGGSVVTGGQAAAIGILIKH